MKKCSPVISFVVLVLVGSVDLSIVLEGNGYKNILVAISDDIPATPDEALVKIQNLKVAYICLLNSAIPIAILFLCNPRYVIYKPLEPLGYADGSFSSSFRGDRSQSAFQRNQYSSAAFVELPRSDNYNEVC